MAPPWQACQAHLTDSRNQSKPYVMVVNIQRDNEILSHHLLTERSIGVRERYATPVQQFNHGQGPSVSLRCDSTHDKPGFPVPSHSYFLAPQHVPCHPNPDHLNAESGAEPQGWSCSWALQLYERHHVCFWQGIAASQGPCTFSVALSAAEIYCERIRCLLDVSADNLSVHGDGHRGIVLQVTPAPLSSSHPPYPAIDCH